MAIRLNTRERWAVGTGAVVVLGFLLYQLLVLPMHSHQERLRRAVAVKSDILSQMSVLGAEYLHLRQASLSTKANLARRGPDFSLFAFVDQLAGESNVKERIAYMKPSSISRDDGRMRVSLVEMKLQEVTLAQLAAFLHRIETSTHSLLVPRLSISRAGQQSGFINVVLRVEALEI